MLNIVTGKINSSKTSKIIEIYNSLEVGDGFVSVKNMNDNIVHSYDILRLATNEKKRLVIRDIYRDSSFVKCCQIGPYLFSKGTVEYIENTFRKLIKDQISPLFLDEVGLLELADLCFHDIFSEMLKSKLDIYITVRKDLLTRILEKYNIKEYNVIEID